MRWSAICLLTATSLLVLALLSGCATSSHLAGPAAYGVMPTQATASAHPTASPTGPAGGPASASSTTSGALQLTGLHSAYSASGTVVVTIHNGLSQTIYVADHQSNCSIVSLQQLVGGQWQQVGTCRIMTLTRLNPLAAGSTTQVSLTPGGGQFATGAWAAGTYRIVLRYTTGTGTSATAGGTVVSAQFTIS